MPGAAWSISDKRREGRRGWWRGHAAGLRPWRFFPAQAGRGRCELCGTRNWAEPGTRELPTAPRTGGFFIFLFFIFVFYKNIFSFSKFTEIYPGRPAAGRPGPGRPAAGRQGYFWKKKFVEKITRRSLGAGRPAAGRAAPQAARQRGGRPWPPGCRATGSPTLI